MTSLHTSLDEVRRRADDQVRNAGYDPDRFEWIGDRRPPDFDPDNPNIVVGLYDTLSTINETIAFLWKWLCMGRNENATLGCQCHKDLLDPNTRFSLSSRIGHEGWPARTRHWVTVDLEAGLNQKPVEAMRAPNIAGLEIMAAMAQHPRVMDTRDGFRQAALNIAGVKTRILRPQNPKAPITVVPSLCALSSNAVVLGITPVGFSRIKIRDSTLRSLCLNRTNPVLLG